MSTPRPTRRASEAACQKTIVAAARLAGWIVHAERPAQMQSGRWSTPIQGDVGFPDLVLLHPRHRLLWFVELKRHPNKVEDSQQAWLDALRSFSDGSIRTFVVYVPEFMDAFIDDLAGVGTVNP